MRSFVLVPLALTCLLLTPAAAQTGSQNNLVLTVFAGAVTGHTLWTVGKQPITVLGDTSGRYDTLRLSRQVSSSLVLGVTATYFPWPHVGFHAEVSYLGLPVDSYCNGVYYHPDTSGGIDLRRNEQMCDDIQAQAGFGGAISVFTGVTLRAASRRAFSPYVRGSVGFVSQPRSMIEMNAAFVDPGGLQIRQILADPKPRNTSVMFGAAVGFTSPLGTGYQFRFEARDVVTSLERLLGPANSLGIGPTAARSYHHFSLTLGFDVVLERKRGRRY